MSEAAANSVLPFGDRNPSLPLGTLSKACAGGGLKTNGKTDFLEWMFCTGDPDNCISGPF